jgi:arylsulfatase A-like enzyme
MHFALRRVRLVPILALCLLFTGLTHVSTAQGTLTGQSATASSRPNILWITSEDNGQELGCYGDAFADSPNIDALAARGMRYTQCWSNAPVCAPARTTIITGCYPPSLGAQHMRSEVAIPTEFRLYPELFRQAGYYCTNNSKEDYNVSNSGDIWNESSNRAHWRKRKAGQPFFSVFNFTISHESRIRDRPHTPIHQPDQVTVPPYHPDTPEVRRDWAQYYDRVTQMDREVGQILQQLNDDGLADNTIVFYYGDHGSGMPRGKRWLYQSGLLVPLIVFVPERWKSLAGASYQAGTTNDDLVGFIDLYPTVLSLANIELPGHLQGRPLLGKSAGPAPRYMYGFRDRMDERIDMSRAVRDKQYLYIRNYYPHRPQGTYLEYMFQTPTTQVWKELYDAGKLTPEQEVFWKSKAPEELYDLSADPHQINNLAASPEHRDTLERLRSALRSWMLEIRDTGFMPEGHMLAQSQARTPYELAHDAAAYPLEAIIDAAELTTSQSTGELSRLKQASVNSHPVIRYWVANGLLATADRLATADQMDQASKAEIIKLARGMSTDTSVYVRCVANEILARYAAEVDRKVAIKALLEEAKNSDKNIFISMAALNALLACQPTRAEIGTSLDGLPERGGNTLSSRYNGYTMRLASRLQEIAQ